MPTIRSERMVRVCGFIISVLLLSGCSANWHIGKALKKDPDALKKRIKAEVRYVPKTIIRDSITHHTDTLWQEITRVEFLPGKTKTEIRYIKKFMKDSLRREQAITDMYVDSIKLLNGSVKLLTQQLKQSRYETKQAKQETKKARKENRRESWSFLFENWWRFLLLLIIAALLIIVVFKYVLKK
ncbi:MAG: hypothetical protein ACRBFS_22900 [Aureispira sp.]